MSPPPAPHEDPCRSLRTFRSLLVGTLTIQGVFIIAALSFSVSAALRTSSLAEQMIGFSERQKQIEQKADSAREDAAQALVISGKAEANIQWIREGLTEMKMMIRQKEQQK